MNKVIAFVDGQADCGDRTDAEERSGEGVEQQGIAALQTIKGDVFHAKN